MDTRIPEPPALNDWRKFELKFALPLLVNITRQLNTDPLSPSGLIVFDYDGVLVDSRDAMIHATNAFCRSHGIKPTINAAAFDTLDPATLVAVARTAAIPETLTSAYARHLFHEFRAAPEQSPIFPGIPKLLENLKRRYTIAIVSANHGGVIGKRLKQPGSSRMFTC